MQNVQLTDWLPTTKKEALLRGWEEVDVVLFSGDAYVDHPSFGAAVIGRVLESEGVRVAIVPQPDWHGDFRDFKKFGKPKMFFAISAGCMDSMVNHYTANRRQRSNDAYSPDGKPHLRPDRATDVYCKILKEIFPETPIVIGGIEASLRRFAHYDYWDDNFRKSILQTSKADLLIYGMGEKSIIEIVRKIRETGDFENCKQIPQTAYLSKTKPSGEVKILPSFEECVADKKVSARAFGEIETASNKIRPETLAQKSGAEWVVVNPPFEEMTTAELDAVHALPFTRLPHPKYNGKTIPAYEMIRFSINTHRGCFGGCAFCTISMHQGKHIVSRSEKSVLQEIEKVAKLPDFKGYLSDVGGPSANMYRLAGIKKEVCENCAKPSCIFPKICQNLNTDTRPMLELYKKIDALSYIKKSFISSGIRYDLLLEKTGDETLDKARKIYTEELIKNHVSGRLKVAPEHTSEAVLKIMRKPSFTLFEKFKNEFDRLNRLHNLNQQLIPYFISSHPGCRQEDMAELAAKTKSLNFHLEQVQDFTPTPLTLATEIYHSGFHPHTLEKLYTAHSQKEKLAQRVFFFWYKKENFQEILQILRRLKREDLIQKLLRK